MGTAGLPLTPTALMLRRMNDSKKFDASEIGDLVVAGVKHAWAEKEPVLLIGLLMGAINAALFWPIVQMGFTAMQINAGSDPAVAEAFLQDMLNLVPLYLLMLLLSTAVMVVVARLATKGRAEVLTGGPAAFATRLLWVFWRFLGMLGWVLLAVLALWLAGIVIGLAVAVLLSLFGTAGSASSIGEGVAILLMVLFMIPAIIGMMFLYGALGLSLISECADHHLTIRRAWGLLKGQRIKLAVALVVLYLGLMVINGSLMALAPIDKAGINDFRLVLSALHIIINIMGTFWAFIWFSMTAVVGEKIDWSEPEPEPTED